MKKLFALFLLAFPLRAQTIAVRNALSQSPPVGLAYSLAAGSGLVLNLAAGVAYCNNTVITYNGGTLTLTASVTNYIYLDPASSCAPGFNSTGFVVGQIPLATVATGVSTITSITDLRLIPYPQPWTVDTSGNVALPSATGLLNLTAPASSITANPAGSGTGAGWKQSFYSNTFASGIAAYTEAHLINRGASGQGWLSVFNTNPANNATTTTPDTNATVSINNGGWIKWANGAQINSGAGVPGGSCTTGSLFMNSSGAAGSVFYVCIASAWVAKF